MDVPQVYRVPLFLIDVMTGLCANDVRRVHHCNQTSTCMKSCLAFEGVGPLAHRIQQRLSAGLIEAQAAQDCAGSGSNGTPAWSGSKLADLEGVPRVEVLTRVPPWRRSTITGSAGGCERVDREVLLSHVSTRELRCAPYRLRSLILSPTETQRLPHGFEAQSRPGSGTIVSMHARGSTGIAPQATAGAGLIPSMCAGFPPRLLHRQRARHGRPRTAETGAGHARVAHLPTQGGIQGQAA